jgi:hypothetical protein
MTNESVMVTDNDYHLRPRGRGTACVNYWCTLPDTKKGANKKARYKKRSNEESHAKNKRKGSLS